MKKNVGKLKIRWRPRKIVTFMTFIFLMGVILSAYFECFFSKYTQKELWLRSCIISLTIFIILILIIYLIVYLKAKKMYEINIKEKICVKGRKKICYIKYEYSQTLIQKAFKIITLKFESEDGRTLLLKDISKKIQDYNL